jgi:hypothetical protein
MEIHGSGDGANFRKRRKLEQDPSLQAAADPQPGTDALAFGVDERRRTERARAAEGPGHRSVGVEVRPEHRRDVERGEIYLVDGAPLPSGGRSPAAATRIQ